MKPYYEDEWVTLWHGDWRELIPEDFRADLILTDPPYGETSLDWDRWPDGWPALAARHADAMWCFGSMRMFLDRRDEFAAWKLSQDVVWDKGRGTGPVVDRFRRVHEHVTHWYRGKWTDVHWETPRVVWHGPRRRATREAGLVVAPQDVLDFGSAESDESRRAFAAATARRQTAPTNRPKET